MKKIVLMLMSVVLLCGCSSSNGVDDKVEMQEVRFMIQGLQVEYGVVSRATVQEQGITDIYVWEGSTLLAHQTSSDDDFGTPSVSLSLGAHNLTFVASKAEGQTWADGVWTCTKVLDTYGGTMAYSVSKSVSEQSVTLTRCNGKVRWTIEDAVPTTAASASISISQCYGLDASLNGVNGGTYTTSLDMSGVVGKTGVTLNAMVLPSSHANGSTSTAAISIVKSDGSSICSYSNDVTVKANQMCNIHGSFFSNSPTLSFSLDSDWGATTQYDI